MFFGRNIVGILKASETEEQFSRDLFFLRMRDRYANSGVGGAA